MAIAQPLDINVGHSEQIKERDYAVNRVYLYRPQCIREPLLQMWHKSKQLYSGGSGLPAG